MGCGTKEMMMEGCQEPLPFESILTLGNQWTLGNLDRPGITPENPSLEF